MNDFWNDPPEHPEPPACPNDRESCKGSGEYLYEGENGVVFSCDTCGYQWVVPFPKDEEPPPEMFHFEELPPATCPHGKTDDCDACDHLADIAYDSERERRYFRR